MFEHEGERLKDKFNTWSVIQTFGIVIILILNSFLLTRIGRLEKDLKKAREELNDHDAVITSMENTVRYMTFTPDQEGSTSVPKDTSTHIHITVSDKDLADKLASAIGQAEEGADTSDTDAPTSTGESTNTESVDTGSNESSTTEDTTTSDTTNSTTETIPTRIEDTGVYGSSGLSAAQLNSVILGALKYYNIPAEKYLAFGHGDAFKRAEEKYGVNALHLIAISQRESGFNTSETARKYNNITSIFKANGHLKQYASVDENIMDTARIIGERYRKWWIVDDLNDVGHHYAPGNKSWPEKVSRTVQMLVSIANNDLSE